MARPATLCYIRKDEHTLMVHRTEKEVDLHKDLYVAPGGKIEPKDKGSLERTMLRETEDETGLTPKDYHLKGFVTFANEKRVFNDGTTAETWGKTWDVAVYLAKDYRGTLKEHGPEGKPYWIPDRELLSLPMHQGDKMFTPWLDNPEYFIATFFYKDKGVGSIQKEFYTSRDEFLEKVRETYGDCL